MKSKFCGFQLGGDRHTKKCNNDVLFIYYQSSIGLLFESKVFFVPILTYLLASSYKMPQTDCHLKVAGSSSFVVGLFLRDGLRIDNFLLKTLQLLNRINFYPAV